MRLALLAAASIYLAVLSSASKLSANPIRRPVVLQQARKTAAVDTGEQAASLDTSDSAEEPAPGSEAQAAAEANAAAAAAAGNAPVNAAEPDPSSEAGAATEANGAAATTAGNIPVNAVEQAPSSESQAAAEANAAAAAAAGNAPVNAAEPDPSSEDGAAAEANVAAATTAGNIPVNAVEQAPSSESQAAAESNAAAGRLPMCSEFPCPAGWAPKVDTDQLSGIVVTDCCDKTCEQYQCPPGFRGHDDYKDNVGSSPKECCDMLCSNIQCSEPGWAVSTEKALQLGTSEEECCNKTCSLFHCIGSWATPPTAGPLRMNFGGDSTIDYGRKVAFSSEECCVPSCASVTCKKDEHGNFDPESTWTHNLEMYELPRPRDNQTAKDYCCLRMCLEYNNSCPEHFGIDGRDKAILQRGTTDLSYVQDCCEAKCSSTTCQKGFVPDTLVSNTLIKYVDFGCCLPTCEVHDCSPGWLKNTKANVLSFAGRKLTDEDCCIATCEVHNCTNNWQKSTDAHKLSQVGKTNLKCCDAFCDHAGEEGEPFDCPSGYKLRPSFMTQLPSNNKHVCCEADMCGTLRNNLTKLNGTDEYGNDINCNHIVDADECNRSFVTLNATESGYVDPNIHHRDMLADFIAVPCGFDSAHGICAMEVKLSQHWCDPL